MRHCLTVILFNCLTGFPIPAWSFDPIKLDFEEWFQLDKSNVKGKEQTRLHGPSKDFDFTVDTGTQYDVWLDTNYAAAGRRSLALKIYSDKNENVKDKIEFNIVKHNEAGRLSLEKDGARYVSFDFLLDPTYEAPREWVMHFQAWQCCGKPPPFAIRVVPKSNIKSRIEFRFLLRDDVIEQTNPRSEGIEIFRMNIPRGKWINMIIWMEPSINDDDKDGRLAMWYDGVQMLDYRRDWGYSTSQVEKKHNKEMRPDMAVKVGIYRRRQANAQIIYFDNIRFGTTYESVTN